MSVTSQYTGGSSFLSIGASLYTWGTNYFFSPLNKLELNRPALTSKYEKSLLDGYSYLERIYRGEWDLAKCGRDLAESWIRSSRVWTRCNRVWMRSSRGVRASGCQCQSHNSPGFDPSILRHSGTRGSARQMKQCWIKYLKRKKKKKIPFI